MVLEIWKGCNRHEGGLVWLVFTHSVGIHVCLFSLMTSLTYMLRHEEHKALWRTPQIATEKITPLSSTAMFQNLKTLSKSHLSCEPALKFEEPPPFSPMWSSLSWWPARMAIGSDPIATQTVQETSYSLRSFMSSLKPSLLDSVRTMIIFTMFIILIVKT